MAEDKKIGQSAKFLVAEHLKYSILGAWGLFLCFPPHNSTLLLLGLSFIITKSQPQSQLLELGVSVLFPPKKNISAMPRHPLTHKQKSSRVSQALALNSSMNPFSHPRV